MYFQKAQTGLFFRTTCFRIYGVTINNLAPMKIVLGCKVGQISSQTNYVSVEI